MRVFDPKLWTDQLKDISEKFMRVTVAVGRKRNLPIPGELMQLDLD